MFQLTNKEYDNLMSQSVISSWGGTRKLPFAFTEHGVTKDIGSESVLSGEEAMKINCAEIFFNQLTLDGYSVSFKKQLNNVGVKSIIEDIIRINPY